MAIFQVLRAGAVAHLAVFPDDAVISQDGATANWTANGVAQLCAAPDGEVFMRQPGALPGYILTGGVLAPPTTSVPALRARANAKLTALLATPRTYAIAGGLSVLCDATPSTGIDLFGLMTWGTANNAATTNWVDDNGGVVTLTGAQCVALAEAVLTYGRSAYAALATAMNGIANASIATLTQVDAVDWPA